MQQTLSTLKNIKPKQRRDYLLGIPITVCLPPPRWQRYSLPTLFHRYPSAVGNIMPSSSLLRRRLSRCRRHRHSRHFPVVATLYLVLPRPRSPYPLLLVIIVYRPHRHRHRDSTPRLTKLSNTIFQEPLPTPPSFHYFKPPSPSETLHPPTHYSPPLSAATN